MARDICETGGQHVVEVATPIHKNNPVRMYGGFKFRARCIKCNRSVVAKKKKDFDEHII